MQLLCFCYLLWEEFNLEVSFAGDQGNTDMKAFCNEVAAEYDRDPSNFPSWFDRTMLWFKQGFVSCQELEDASTNLANRGKISGEIQQDIQLVSLGGSTTQRAEENIRQDEEIERIKEQINEVNTRLSSQVVDVGNSVTDASLAAEQAGTESFLSGLGLGALGGGGAVLLIVAFILLKK